MDTPDLLYHSACALGGMVRSKEVSSQEIVKTQIDYLGRLNPILNAVIQIAPDSAMKQARLADEAVSKGVQLGPLHGVPFTVKDVYEIKDAAVLESMPGMAPLLPLPRDRDATAIVRLRAAGAILIAVTRATIWKDREERYGSVRNPYNLKLDASGSSGGEAAIIAAGGSPLGLGSDSGGSLRTPAGRCGIATIRPSNGRVPRASDAGGTADPRTVAGPLARFVEDIAVALSIISGTNPLDPTTLPLPLCDWRSVQLKDLRVGVFLDDSFEAPTPLAIKAVQDASDVLRIEGAKVIAARPPDLAESWNITQEYWRGYPDGANASLVYEGFLNRWDKYRVALGLFMQDFDLVIAPVDPLVYTCVFSLVGWPSVVVRGGTDRDGLPIGVQLIGKPWCDHVALAAAAGVERALGGWRPPRS